MSPRQSTTVALAVAAGSLIAAPALAQNALGDGRALENNLLSGSNRQNFTNTRLTNDLAFRNAVVTGNVGGGMQFRGDIGYTGATDFRGELGSDEVFNFQRDTQFSGLATRNVRGLGAVQLQLDLPIGGQTIGAQSSDFIINRPGAGFSSAQASLPQSAIVSNRVFDPFNSISGSLRSTSRFTLESVTQPQILGQMGPTQGQPDGPRGLISASDLHGVKILPQFSPAFGQRDDPATRVPLEALDGTQLPALSPTVPATPRSGEGRLDPQSDTNAQPARTGDRIAPDALSNPSLSPDRAAISPGTYQAAMGELRLRSDRFELTPANQAAATTATEPPTDAAALVTPSETDMLSSHERLVANLEEIRRSLLPGANPLPPGYELPDLSKKDPDKPTDGSEPSLVNLDIDRERKAPEVPQVEGEDPLPTRDTLTIRRGDGEPITINAPTGSIAKPTSAASRIESLLKGPEIKITTLKSTQTANQLFAEHMKEGERALADARWFDAEERFTAALTLNQGDPMAAAGRANAQLGSGMFLSAAVNIRNLFRAYPELMAVRFDEKLLPRAERLDKLREQLRYRSRLDTPVARDAGLLLAYLGHQFQNQSDITEGFAVMDRVERALGVDREPLDNALRMLWLK